MNAIGFNQVMPWAMGHPHLHALPFQLGSFPLSTWNDLFDTFDPFDDETTTTYMPPTAQQVQQLRHLLNMQSWSHGSGPNTQTLQNLQRNKWIWDLIRSFGPRSSRRYYNVKNHFGVGHLGGVNMAQMANVGGPGGMNLGNIVGGGAMGMMGGGIHPHAIGGVYHPGPFALMGSPFSWWPNNAPMMYM